LIHVFFELTGWRRLGDVTACRLDSTVVPWRHRGWLCYHGDGYLCTYCSTLQLAVQTSMQHNFVSLKNLICHGKRPVLFTFPITRYITDVIRLQIFLSHSSTLCRAWYCFTNLSVCPMPVLQCQNE